MNTITFCKEYYGSEDEMWKDIQALVKILTRADYVMKFYCDEPELGIYVLEFDSRDEGIATKTLVWEDID